MVCVVPRVENLRFTVTAWELMILIGIGVLWVFSCVVLQALSSVDDRRISMTVLVFDVVVLAHVLKNRLAAGCDAAIDPRLASVVDILLESTLMLLRQASFLMTMRTGIIWTRPFVSRLLARYVAELAIMVTAGTVSLPFMTFIHACCFEERLSVGLYLGLEVI